MKPFEKGDRVFDLRLGFGNVEKIDPVSNERYPVFVDYPQAYGYENYTLSGVWHDRFEERPSLWHADLVDLKEYVAGLKGE